MRKIDGKSIEREAGDRSASPFLIFTAVVLFTILAIDEADLHRDKLSTIGLIISSEGIDARFAGP